MDSFRTLYLVSVTLHLLAAALWAGGMLFLVLVTVILVLSGVHDFVVGPRASALLATAPGSPRALRWQDAARWMGRINLLFAIAVIALAVALARGGW